MLIVNTVHRTNILHTLATRTLLLAATIVLGTTQSFATQPPLDGSKLTARQLSEFNQLHEEFHPSGIALRLQEIKQAKLDAIAGGRVAPTQVITYNLPVILGDYWDNWHIFDSTDFQEMLFGSNPNGNLTDYFSELSYGQLQLTGTVYGPYLADSVQSYYTSGGAFPQRGAGFVHNILSKADPDIDFSQYDNDGPDGIPNSGDDDGIVDGVLVIFPDGAKSQGDDNLGASFQYMYWAGAPEYETGDSADGGGVVIVDEHIKVSAERGDGTLDQITGIGVTAHEFGHLVGLPDQYDGDGTSSGVGTWCLMGTGTYGAGNNTAGVDTPTHMCAWCKAYVGFLIPIEVVGTETVTLPPVETSPTVYKLWDDAYQGERYFLLENRTKTGFDSEILGEGVLIWHCNGDAQWDNRDDSFRIVDLEEADGSDDLDNRVNKMDDGDPYPGTSNNSSFNDATYPDALDVFGAATGASAENIAYTAGPGSDVTATLTQRNIEGFTLSYHVFSWMRGIGNSTPTSRWGALRFTTPEEGELVAVQAGVKKNVSYDYEVRVCDDVSEASGLIGVHDSLTTSGVFPVVTSKRYYEIPLVSSLQLSAGQTFAIDVHWGPVEYALMYHYNHPVSGKSYWSTNGATYYLWAGGSRDAAIRARIKYPCCQGMRGDINGDGADLDIVDLTCVVDFLFGAGCVQPCPLEADPNGDSSVSDIVDLTFVVDWLFGISPTLVACP